MIPEKKEIAGVLLAVNKHASLFNHDD